MAAVSQSPATQPPQPWEEIPMDSSGSQPDAVTIYRDGFHYRVDKKTMEKLDLPEWLRIPPSRKADLGCFQGSVTADRSTKSQLLFPAMKCGRSSCQLVVLSSRQAQFGQCMASGSS
ncbi:ppsD [Symbiodinium sp. CCMP2592]|nr:ppsD [Symbiodinium sp. CCMP2592]